MDLATHAVAGLLVARTRAAWVGRAEPAAVLVAASLLPDIDMVVVVVDPTRAALLRHTLTHSLVVMPALAAGFALLARGAGGRDGFVATFLLAATGMAVHVALDLLNAYGVLLFYPLSEARIDLGLLFVIDPVFTGILAGGLGLSFWPSDRHRMLVARLAVLLAVSHIGVAALLRDRAAEMLAANASGLVVGLVPEPLAPWHWRGIAAHPGGYDQFAIRPVAGRILALPPVASASTEPAVAVVRRSALPWGLDAFLRAPVWRVDGSRVTVHDLRFRFSNLGNDWDPFDFSFDVVDQPEVGTRLVGTTLGERIARSLATLSAIAAAKRGLTDAGDRENSHR
ncbi:membrane-bound metal-dependent hydrolase YbcI (DUF457 family) [Stella humosa]|uniref:Membrane-bound metal-dependent hydrolase YbcI (DUF457 family) n=1 Tax=Stella humosa TaxID=94 RepID=A0A3N1KSB9_9PROT|nr:metal-dependent hydrolase [Stella humosa]ROP81006.1 membrane-bound metal-dependent hydrolase YbcI (DUF457 family) [Stella humosa]BBK29695.1 hypothetical protein STHU_03290 [Stella humosa]